jgi:hypothetical protein
MLETTVIGELIVPRGVVGIAQRELEKALWEIARAHGGVVGKVDERREGWNEPPKHQVGEEAAARAANKDIFFWEPLPED